MPSGQGYARPDEPASYRIRASGRFPEALDSVYHGLSIVAHPSGADSFVTDVVGTVADQTALLSLLTYLYDMGLVLLSVEGTDTAPLPRTEDDLRGGDRT